MSSSTLCQRRVSCQLFVQGRRVGRRSFGATSHHSSDKSTSLLRRAWQQYSDALYKRPLRTKTTVAALIFFSSDCVTQYVTAEDTIEWDASRSLSGAAFGVVATGWLHFWWGFLENFMEARIPVKRHRLGNTLAKILIDQGLGAPFYIYSYYYITNLLQTMSSKATLSSPNEASGTKKNEEQHILTVTHNKAWPHMVATMPRHWKIWPPVHALNFYFVPLHHRVIIQNTVLVGWSGYLSHLNHGGLDPDEARGFD